MPDNSGVLSKADIDQIISRLIELDRQRGENLSCSVCSHQKWTVQPQIIGLPSSGGFGAPSIGSIPQRVIMLTCNNCGHSLFFEASKMGFPLTISTGNALNALSGGLGNLSVGLSPKNWWEDNGN